MSDTNQSAEHRHDQRIDRGPSPEDMLFELTPRTARLNPSDYDSEESAVEIVILWGELSILHVAHISPPRDFCVGDAIDAT